MRAEINRGVLEKIEKLFLLAKKSDNILSKKQIALARELAKRSNIRLPEKLRRNFCHRCNVYLKPENKKVRISNGKVSVKCLNCGSYVRYKIKK